MPTTIQQLSDLVNRNRISSESVQSQKRPTSNIIGANPNEVIPGAGFNSPYGTASSNVPIGGSSSGTGFIGTPGVATPTHHGGGGSSGTGSGVPPVIIEQGIQPSTISPIQSQVLTYQNVPVPNFNVASSGGLPSPTQAEALQSGGGIFLKASEISSTTLNEGEPGYGQKTIAQAERILGQKEGSSGAGFIPEVEGNIPKPTPLPEKVLHDLLQSSFEAGGGTRIGIPDITGLGIRPAVTQALTGKGAQVLGYALPGFRDTGELLDIAIPKTIKGGAEFVGLGLAVISVPILAIPLGGYILYSGIKGALNPDLTLPERVVSGTQAGLAGVGLGFELAPYVRGIKARFSSDYAPVKVQEEGFRAVELKVGDTTYLKPSDYAKALKEQGELSFSEIPLKQLEATEGKGVGGYYTKVNGKDIIVIARAEDLTTSSIPQEEILAHELIHMKTPDIILQASRILPYPLRPSELLAYGFQDILAERGFAYREKITIGLILEKSPLKEGITTDIALPDISPLKRGGFEVKQSEKKIFLGKQTVATSQIGFFEEGKVIPLLRPFYTTPEEPFLNIPETRLSRLGLSNLFEIPKKVKIEFGLPKTPQIGYESDAVVSRFAGKEKYKIGGGTELEAVKDYGTIYDIKKVGVTSIKGKGVDIYEFKTRGGGVRTGEVAEFKTPSTEGFTRVSGESILSSALGASTRMLPYTRSVSSLRTITGTRAYGRSQSYSIGNGESISSSTQEVYSGSYPKSYYTTKLDITTNAPYKTTTTTNINYYEDIKRKPPISKLGFPIISPKKEKTKTSQVPTYNVFLRRRGQFTSIGTELQKGQALQLGSERALKDLSRKFKLVPTGKTTEVFAGFNENQYIPKETQFRGYIVRKGKRIETPNIWTQRTSANLQSFEEKFQIQEAKRLKKLGIY